MVMKTMMIMTRTMMMMLAMGTMSHLGMYISILRASSQLPTCSFAHISTGLFVLMTRSFVVGMVMVFTEVMVKMMMTMRMTMTKRESYQ